MKERRVETGGEQGRNRASRLEAKEGSISLRGLWIGCGEFTRRCWKAVQELRELGVETSFMDIRRPNSLRIDPTAGNFPYFNWFDPGERRALTREAEQEHYDVIVVANWAQSHMITAAEHTSTCDGIVLLTKPVDSNFQLLKTIRETWPPELLDSLYVHDHYLNKSGVEAFGAILPELVERYGRPTSFWAFLVEPKTAEEEERVDALQCGVSLDLLWHLLSITQVYFPTTRNGSGEGLYTYQPLRVEEVLRGQYRHSALSEAAETLAVVNAVIPQEFAGRDRRVLRDVRAQYIVAKGIQVDRSDPERSLKAVKVAFQGREVTLNIGEEAISPLPSDLRAKVEGFPRESGFFRPVLEGIAGYDQKDLLRRHFMSFQQAYEVACLLERVHIQGVMRPMFAHDQHEELGSVLKDCTPLLTRGLELPTDRQIADILAIK